MLQGFFSAFLSFPPSVKSLPRSKLCSVIRHGSYGGSLQCPYNKPLTRIISTYPYKPVTQACSVTLPSQHHNCFYEPWFLEQHVSQVSHPPDWPQLLTCILGLESNNFDQNNTDNRSCEATLSILDSNCRTVLRSWV